MWCCLAAQEGGGGTLMKKVNGSCRRVREDVGERVHNRKKGRCGRGRRYIKEKRKGRSLE